MGEVLTTVDGHKKIEYIYLDVDNRKLVKSYEELIDIYSKNQAGVIFKMSYPCIHSGQWLIALSKRSHSECSLRIILRRMWNKLQEENKNVR